MIENKSERSDPWLTLLAIGATMLGILAVWDAGYSRAAASGQLIPREVINQVVFSVVAVIAGHLVSKAKPQAIRRLTPLIGVVCVVLLAAVLIPGVGKEVNNARRWIGMPFGTTLQPAELAKIGCILLTAALVSGWKSVHVRKDRPWFERYDQSVAQNVRRLWPLALILVTFLFLEIESDLGTAAVTAFAIFGVLVAANVKPKILIGVAVCGLTLAGTMVLRAGYRQDRIVNHVQRWQPEFRDGLGYQTTQSEIAMARGGLFGQGFGSGRAKHKLPVPTSDFVLATIAEEFGLLGSLVVIALVGGVALRLAWLGTHARDRFGRSFVLGVAIWIGIQAATNIVMANGLIPPIGIPLPFISYGGSSLVALWIAVGMSQSLIRSTQPKLEVVHGTENHRLGRRDGRARLSRA